MADENQVESLEQTTTPEIDPVEEQARAQGWVPKEEFTGEGKWRPAQEFVDRGELFAKIETQNKSLKEVRQALELMKEHHSKVQEAAYKKALADLKTKKKEALIEGDADLVIEVDEQLDAVKDAQRQLERQPAQRQEPAQEHPVFVNWKNQNSWYENNKPMRGWADNRGVELAAEGKHPDEVLRIVAQEVRKEFPNRFENPNRNKAGAVEGSPQRGRQGSDGFQLTEDQQVAMKKFVKMGVMTEKEYIDDIRALSK